MGLAWRRLAGLVGMMDGMGTWLPQLVLRGLLAYEFGMSGLLKLRGANWFPAVQASLPFPINHLPADATWVLAIALELAGAVCLALGLGTRIAGALLALLTLAAVAAIHAGHGYNVCGNGWKLPLFYLAMLLPLILSGPGRLSIDHLLKRRYFNAERRIWA